MHTKAVLVVDRGTWFLPLAFIDPRFAHKFCVLALAI